MQNQADKVNIVFTGPATDRHGRQVLRADLKALAEANGYVVQNRVNERTYALIASRIDTVKATAGQNRGLLVCDYASFIDSLGGEVPKAGGVFHWMVDGLKPAKPELVLDPNADYL